MIFGLKDKQILNYQNCVSFFVSIFSSYNLYYYYNYQYTDIFRYNTQLIFLHCLTDLLFAKNDILIHHIFVISIFLFNSYNNIPINESSIFLSELILTEVSTIFLVLRYWINDVSYYNILNQKYIYILTFFNDLLFFITFFKFRIFNYYNLLQNIEFYKYVSNHYTNYIDYSIFYFSIYGLFILNLYWFNIILKKIYKSLFINLNHIFSIINNSIFNEYLLQYTYFINIIITFYNYDFTYNNIFYIEFFGIIILSFSSFYFHNCLFNSYKKYNSITLNSSDIIYSYIIDVYSIQFRSFCCVIVSCFFDLNNLYGYIILSLSLHLISLYLFINTSIYTILNNKLIIFNIDNKISENIIYVSLLKLFTCIPSIINTIIIMINTNNLILNNQLLFVNILVGFSIFISPFYNFSHVYFHILLMLQTYIICNCNTYVSLVSS